MRKQLVLALAAMFVGFMGIAMLVRTGHLYAVSVYDVVQLICCGACVGAAIVIFVNTVNKTSVKSVDAGMPLSTEKSGSHA
jgi:hypothetical protein